MKKLRTFAVLASTAILSLLPMTVHADTVDDICDKYGYDYRWTIEAKLDESYDGLWAEEIAKNGKIKISYIDSDGLGSKHFNGVLVIEGSEIVYFGMDASVNKDNGICVYDEIAWDGDEWTRTRGGDREAPKVYIYGSGDSGVEDRFIYISELGKANTTPIVLRNKYMDEAEDTEMSLEERRKELYALNKSSRTPEALAKYGRFKSDTVIDAKPVVREDKKTPTVDDNYFLEDDERTEIDYASDKDIPDFDISLAEAKKMPEISVEQYVKDFADDIGYSVTILNGRDGNRIIQSVPGGMSTFKMTLPKEKTEGVSSTGKVTVEMQAFDKYDTSILDETMEFELAGSQEYWEVYELVVTIKGDLGEQAYLIDTAGKEYSEDGTCFAEFELYKILKMNNDFVIYQTMRKEPYKEGVKCFFIDKNEEYMYFKLEENFLRCEFADKSYCGIEKIGFKLGDEICMIDLNKTKTDFELELDLSSNVIGRKAARKLLSEIRAERTKNNEVVNVLEDGKSDVKVDTKPEDKKTEDKPATLPTDKNEICVNLGGKFIDFIDQKPIIDNDRVLVPFRVIFEALGAEVSWDGDTKTVTATKGNITISLTIGENTITKNGQRIDIDVPAQIKNERTLVPIRVVSESLENVVSWDGENKIVEIK